jgi:hypothetical protein
MIFKEKIEDYTEAEFLSFLQEFFDDSELTGDQLGEYISKLSKHFEQITEHPEKSALIFYPQQGREDSPEGVLSEVKRWRKQNGKPGFKPE